MLYRNQEVRRLVWISAAIGILSTVVAGFVSIESAIITLLASLSLIFAFLWFTRWRYREIEKLSGYLRQIASGDYSLDVRDNKEGELSILKNDIYKMTLMLSEQSAALQQDKVRLTDAISDISHQLKTPLSSMMVMADLLRDGGLPELKRAEFTRHLRVQLERIEWLISSLLKLSKIDAGTVHFKRDAIQAGRLIDNALTPLQIPIEIKQLNIEIDGDPTVMLACDMNWTVEALINILKNAVEHTPDGGTIWIAYTDNALFTEIVVADNGIGIAKEDVPFIFRRFYKGKHAKEGSIGIGLALAHSIITSQGGHIEVRRGLREGKGTEFRMKMYKTIV